MKTEANLINITNNAVKELTKLNISKEEFLRIALVEGGCSGHSYQLTSDTVQTPFDIILFEDDSIKVVSDNNSIEYLKGLNLDYTEDLVNAGFRFDNPNAISSCGCGSSAEF